jgi:hypothetical protein
MMNTINDIPKKNSFKVPENYFEEVNNKILSSTIGKTIKSGKKPIYRRLKPLLAVAASLAFFAVLSYTLVKIIYPANKNELFPPVSIEDFSETYLNDIDIITLENDAAQVVTYDRIPEVSPDDIIEYLILENIDPSEIYKIL